MKTERYRDLVLTYLDDDTVLVTACDSFGSIGEKECDELKCPAEVVGKVILRTPLLEVMCFGAEIVAVTDIICNEMVTYGERIIRAIKEEMKGAGLDPEMLNGSTEENFVSRMTGIGAFGAVGASGSKEATAHSL